MSLGLVPVGVAPSLQVSVVVVAAVSVFSRQYLRLFDIVFFEFWLDLMVVLEFELELVPVSLFKPTLKLRLKFVLPPLMSGGVPDADWASFADVGLFEGEHSG